MATNQANSVCAGRPESRLVSRLRTAARIAIPAGAAGSLALMVYAGRRNSSRILLLLFTLWVLAPFLAAAGLNLRSKRWPVLTRAALYTVTLVVALGSLAAYGAVAWHPPKQQAAFPFVVVPLISWLLMAAVPIAAWRSGAPAD